MICSAFPVTRGGSLASTLASSWGTSMAGTAESVGVMGLFSSTRSSDIGNMETSPFGLDCDNARSALRAVVAEAATEGRLDSNDDALSPSEILCCLTFQWPPTWNSWDCILGL